MMNASSKENLNSAKFCVPWRHNKTLIPLAYINNGYIGRKRHTDEFKSKNMKGIDVKNKADNLQPE